jgi:hypothetical protein
MPGDVTTGLSPGLCSLAAVINRLPFACSGVGNIVISGALSALSSPFSSCRRTPQASVTAGSTPQVMGPRTLTLTMQSTSNCLNCKLVNLALNVCPRASRSVFQRTAREFLGRGV